MTGGVYPHQKQNLEERFWSKVDCGTDDECWEWKSYKNKDGYGVFRLNDQVENAHRVSYRFECREILDGMDIHHKCQNRVCCNPHHLIQMPRGEHISISKRGVPINHKKTHCKQGHEFTEENTVVGSKGGRKCRYCVKEYNREYRQTHQEKIKILLHSYRQTHKEQLNIYQNNYRKNKVCENGRG